MLTLGTSASHADKTEELLQACKIWAKAGYPKSLGVTFEGMQMLGCQAYMTSWHRSGELACDMMKETVLSEEYYSIAFSAPSPAALAQAFINFAEDNPQYWDNSGVWLGPGFLKAFPCTK